MRGYERERFLRDLGAGLTVAVVALPLAMAFAIASGLKPEAGLWTAIIAGLLISVLGGSNVQIGGPAGAFIVIVYGIVEQYGLANLLISTACAGVLLFAMGLLRLGRLVRYVPISIVIGFTNGIAVLIASSQLKDWLGLDDRQDAGRLLHAVEGDRPEYRELQPLFVRPRAGLRDRAVHLAAAVERPLAHPVRDGSAGRAARGALQRAYAGDHRGARDADPAVLVLRASPWRP